MASDTGGARLNRIEIPAHREALAKALRKRYEEMAAGPAPAGRILSRPGSRGIVKYAVPALAAIALCATVLAVLVVSWPGGGGTDRTTRTVMTGSQALAAREEARATGFDFALFKEVSGGVPGNVVLSPLSARMALAMAYNGASDEVAGEMAYVLDFEGMDLDDVRVVMGDTDRAPYGLGSWGSRGAVVMAGSVVKAAEHVVEKAKQIASHLLEANEGDIVMSGSAFVVRVFRAAARSATRAFTPSVPSGSGSGV